MRGSPGSDAVLGRGGGGGGCKRVDASMAVNCEQQSKRMNEVEM